MTTGRSANLDFSSFRWLVCALVVFAVLKAPAVGQIDRAVLEGTITDPTGAAIVGADVRILAVDTGITKELQTNAQNPYFRPSSTYKSDSRRTTE